MLSAAAMRHKSTTVKGTAEAVPLSWMLTGNDIGKHQRPQRALAARWGGVLRWFWELFSGRVPLPASRLKGGLPSSAGRVRG